MAVVKQNVEIKINQIQKAPCQRGNDFWLKKNHNMRIVARQADNYRQTLMDVTTGDDGGDAFFNTETCPHSR